MLELTPATRTKVGPLMASCPLLAALVVAMFPRHPTSVIIALAALGTITGALQTVPRALRAAWREPSLLLVAALAGLLVAWFVVGLNEASAVWHPESLIRNGSPLPANDPIMSVDQTSWPWHVGNLPIWPLFLAIVCAAGGFVLIADAIRVQVGVAGPPRSAWRVLTASPTRGSRIAVRAAAGVALVCVTALLAVSLVNRLTDYHPLGETLGIVAVTGLSMLLVASPVAVGLAMRLELDKETRVREEERQRFAAHLHDSVLQTLALIQRQATEPAVVLRLARRQEHALRVWMAGDADVGTSTLAVAVREMVSDLEQEHDLKVEVTVTGDVSLDTRNEEMIAAAREALLNVAHHAPGAPVNVFLDVSATGTEMFIRDSGPGFPVTAIPAERRGLRDAVIGRMRSVGGTATVESVPGEGTEIALKLPHQEALRR